VRNGRQRRVDESISSGSVRATDGSRATGRACEQAQVRLARRPSHLSAVSLACKPARWSRRAGRRGRTAELNRPSIDRRPRWVLDCAVKIRDARCCLALGWQRDPLERRLNPERRGRAWCEESVGRVEDRLGGQMGRPVVGRPWPAGVNTQRRGEIGERWEGEADDSTAWADAASERRPGDAALQIAVRVGVVERDGREKRVGSRALLWRRRPGSEWRRTASEKRKGQSGQTCHTRSRQPARSHISRSGPSVVRALRSKGMSKAMGVDVREVRQAPEEGKASRQNARRARARAREEAGRAFGLWLPGEIGQAIVDIASASPARLLRWPGH
jgi:hypothetical protein